MQKISLRKALCLQVVQRVRVCENRCAKRIAPAPLSAGFVAQTFEIL